MSVYKFVDKKPVDNYIEIDEINEQQFLRCYSDDDIFVSFFEQDSKGKGWWKCLNTSGSMVDKNTNLAALVENMKNNYQGFKVVQVVDFFEE